MNQTGFLAVIPSILRALSEGNMLRKFYSMLIKAQGIITGIGMIVVVIYVLRGSFDNNLPVLATIAGIISSIILAIGGVALVQIYFYRADTVLNLGDSPFTVIPIISVFIRLWGEVLAFCYTLVFVLMLVVLLISLLDERVRWALSFIFNAMPGSSYGRFGGDGGSIAISLGIAALIPIFIITIAYFFSEGFVVVVDIARHIRFMVGQSGVAATHVSDSGHQVEDTTLSCPNCGAPIGPDDTFCTECGHKLT